MLHFALRAGAETFLTLPGVGWAFESALPNMTNKHVLSFEHRHFRAVANGCPFTPKSYESKRMLHPAGELREQDVFAAIASRGGIPVDVAWLDLCGPPRNEWVPLLQAQLDASRVLSVTMQRARSLGQTHIDVRQLGGVTAWLVHHLGKPSDVLEYGDTTPMTQCTWSRR